MIRLRWTSVFLVAALSVRAPCSASATGNPETVYPGAAWDTKGPNDVGLSEDKLRALAKLVEGQGCVVRHGFLVFTWGNAGKSSDVASAFKPVLSTLLFFAIQEGRLQSPDDHVCDFEPRLKELNQGKDARITWRHLASQTSGYGLTEAPGAAYAYNDFALALYYDTLTQKVFGTNGTEVLRQRLAEPLQFQDPCSFDAFARGTRPGRLIISVRDFARFGLFCMRGGQWREKQILQRRFIEQAIHSPISADTPVTSGREADMLPNQRSVGGSRNITGAGPGFYSFNWWTNGIDKRGQRLFRDCPADTYIAAGHGGKRMLWVLPRLDLLVVWNDSPIEDFDDSPSNPATRCNQAARLIAQSVIAKHD